MDRVIYFDNNATTRPLDAVIEAMVPILRDGYANPSSIHQFGQQTRHRVEVAREQTAALIGASAREIVFTSGGTESINLAIRGVLSASREKRHVITSAVEHSAVRNLCGRLTDEGFAVDVLGVDGSGRLVPNELADRLRPDTALVSVMHANNETGVLFPIARVAAICAERGVPLHVDAVQSVGKLPIDVQACPMTLMSLSGHKFHGPKGTGALYVRRRTRIDAQIVGGSQERELRGGTEHVAGIVGMGVAAEAAERDMAAHAVAVGALRDRLEQRLVTTIGTSVVMGGGAERIYNTTNVAFAGLEAEAILILLSGAGICASSGSACSSGSLEPSHVIAAMGVDPRIGHGAIRFSLSHFNSADEVDEVCRLMPQIVARLESIGSASRG
ncbi:MAG: aminotransferase class V-fold PLP-dependent enzyme [Phycisphaerales bacterium]|nr:aminotransferase class V-fold PLP-dependent enzyme [Phycisphaerales bacterium]